MVQLVLVGVRAGIRKHLLVCLEGMVGSELWSSWCEHGSN